MRSVVPQFIKLVVFLVITAVFTYILGATISNASYGSSVSYKAMFTDVTGLNEGDDIRIAGVRVGTVESIKLLKRDDGRKSSIAEVEFTVQKSRPLPDTATARLRYRNLVGQRYIDIARGAGASNKMLGSGGTIPLQHTTPAVDLTVLFQGFQPLTQGLDGDTLNQLSLEIVKTLQGEAGSLQTLLANLADLTNTLADKDQVIGSVIDNLSSVLNAVGQRDEQLTQLIIQLKNFVSGLAQDRKTIGNAIVGINGLLTKIRAPLKNDVVQLNGLVATLNKHSDTTTFVLKQLPPTVAGLIRTASYGSWFNFYLCSIEGQVSIGTLAIPIPHAETGTGSRCG
jgi:phospholipid/cholesterol/gamma-HCH transport system substrate-binding protein